ncbi:MAG: hypothetical protein AAF355_03795 [Myxococcota bacterium]
MPSVLKGNFKTEKTVEVHDVVDDSIEQRFEKEALKHLGGSVCFVAKKQVDWGSEKDDGSKKDSD